MDFAEPMNTPWLILGTDEDDNFDGWTDDNTCKIGRRYEVVNLPGHALHGKKEDDCTADELGAVETEASRLELGDGDEGEEPGWKYVTESHVWTRPSSQDIVRKWVSEQVPWRLKSGGGLYPDAAVQFGLMWGRLSPDEQTSMLAEDTVGDYCRHCIEWAKAPRTD